MLELLCLEVTIAEIRIETILIFHFYFQAVLNYVPGGILDLPFTALQCLVHSQIQLTPLILHLNETQAYQCI